MNSRAGHRQAEAEVDRLRTSIPTGRWLHFGFQIDTAVPYRAGITGETYLRGGANRKRAPLPMRFISPNCSFQLFTSNAAAGLATPPVLNECGAR